MTDLPILLTSSVEAMDSTGQLNDPELRIKHTLESIDQWGRINPKGRFIICDGSNFSFAPIIRKKFPGLMIECLYFLNDHEKVKKYGKGYGEGEIIQYAIRESEVIREQNTFVKCTAKLWVSNYHNCINQWRGKFLASAHFSRVFSLKQPKLCYLDTRFYITDKSYFQEHFKEAHLGLGEKSGLSIEDQYLDVILSKKEKNVLFKVPPIICGVGGGSGKYYKNNLIRISKDRLRNWIVKNNNSYRNLFIS